MQRFLTVVPVSIQIRIVKGLQVVVGQSQLIEELKVSGDGQPSQILEVPFALMHQLHNQPDGRVVVDVGLLVL